MVVPHIQDEEDQVNSGYQSVGTEQGRLWRRNHSKEMTNNAIL